jgi:hypothetical protein
MLEAQNLTAVWLPAAVRRQRPSGKRALVRRRPAVEAWI